MANWNKIYQKRENGETVEMISPIILSASRSTDIPAFYADWFFHRLEKGYCKWINPFNGTTQFVSLNEVQFIVFWTKNPIPLLPYLSELEKRGIGWYVQYTLNDYVDEGLEKGVPPLEQRINTFIELAEMRGSDRVIWRFDPLLLTKNMNIDKLLSKINNIGELVYKHTHKLVFSFADIANYTKVAQNLTANNIHYIDWTPEQMHRFAEGLVQLNRQWNLALATCSEKIDMHKLGIKHNLCIDDGLISRLAYNNRKLMDYLGAKFYQSPEFDLFGIQSVLPDNAITLPDGRYVLCREKADNGQRLYCRCVGSKDIGQYNTCAHLCEYCYANSSKEEAIHNLTLHKTNPFGETIYG